MGRIEMVLGPDAHWEVVRDRLSRVFGVGELRAGRARAARHRGDRRGRSSRDLGIRENRATFRVSARRADKRFPLTSPEIEREVGGRIKEARGWHVDLAQSGADHPRRGADRRGVLLLRQGARRRRAAGRRQRQGRLPAVGRHRFAGRGVADDAARLPRRCSSTSTATRSCRARRRRRRASWSRLLTRFQFRSRLFLVPFGEIQQQVVLAVPPPLRVVIYRRLMMRIAERDRARAIARRRSSPARWSARSRRRRSRT